MITFRQLCLGTLLGFIISMGLVMILGNMGVFAQTQTAQQQQTATTQKVAEVQEQVNSNSLQSDATLAGLGVTGAGLAATFIRSFIKGRELEKSDKRTDRDTMMSQLFVYRLIQTMDAMIPAVSRCLDQPFNSDPMQKHITIRMKLADDANNSAQYLMTALNTAPPSMTPAATVIVADAMNNPTADPSTTTTVNKTEIKTTTPPANNTTAAPKPGA